MFVLVFLLHILALCCSNHISFWCPKLKNEFAESLFHHRVFIPKLQYESSSFTLVVSFCMQCSHSSSEPPPTDLTGTSLGSFPIRETICYHKVYAGFSPASFSRMIISGGETDLKRQFEILC